MICLEYKVQNSEYFIVILTTTLNENKLRRDDLLREIDHEGLCTGHSNRKGRDGPCTLDNNSIQCGKDETLRTLAPSRKNQSRASFCIDNRTQTTDP